MSTAKARAQLFRTLPASATSDGLLRARLSAILACWPDSHSPIARDAIARHPPSGLVHFENEPQLTRWHTHWLASWVAGVLRVDARDLISLADADGPTR